MKEFPEASGILFRSKIWTLRKLNMFRREYCDQEKSLTLRWSSNLGYSNTMLASFKSWGSHFRGSEKPRFIAAKDACDA